MRVLIVDQCSGSKSHPEYATVYDTDDIDDHGLDGLRAAADVTLPARDLYDGRQQRFVDDAVERLRADGHAVDRLYVSAGFGLVSETTRLPVYEATFREMDAETASDRAAALGVTDEVVELLTGDEPYDLAFFPLGSDYTDALRFGTVLDAVPSATTAVLFNRESAADDRDNVVSLPARTAQAKAHGTITVALKGQYLRNFATRVGDTRPEAETLVDLCTRTESTQTGFEEF